MYDDSNPYEFTCHLIFFVFILARTHLNYQNENKNFAVVGDMALLVHIYLFNLR